MTTFMFIPYHKQRELIRKGWRMKPLVGKHAQYSVLAIRRPWWRRWW